MKKISDIDINPHIRGMKLKNGYCKLTDRAKDYYRLLIGRQENNDTVVSFKNTRPYQKISFDPTKSSQIIRTNTSSKMLTSEKSCLVLKKHSKETLTSRKREFSAEEQLEIDRFISERLKNKFNSIKNTIKKRINNNNKHKIFSEELNTLRADTQAAVVSKMIEQKIMPGLKKQAFSKVFLKRNTKIKLDDARQRQEMRERMGEILVNKNSSVKDNVNTNNANENIEEICLNAQKNLKIYKVKIM